MGHLEQIPAEGMNPCEPPVPPQPHHNKPWCSLGVPRGVRVPSEGPQSLASAWPQALPAWEQPQTCNYRGREERAEGSCWPLTPAWGHLDWLNWRGAGLELRVPREG